MPRMFDAGEMRQQLTWRIKQLLDEYGSGSEEYDDQGWQVTPVTADSLLVSNPSESGTPRFLITVETERQ